MTTEQHLAHLLQLLAPPFSSHWKAYVWERAKEIAANDREHADLPEMLKRAVLAQRPNSTSSEKPVEQPGTDSSDPKPADTSTTRQPASTGLRRSSLREGS